MNLDFVTNEQLIVELSNRARTIVIGATFDDAVHSLKYRLFWRGSDFEACGLARVLAQLCENKLVRAAQSKLEGGDPE
jgi:hypothetical protein